MRYDYSKAVNTARRLLDKFGVSAIAENSKEGVNFDPTDPSSLGVDRTEGAVLKTGISKYYADKYKSLIKTGDIMLICAATLDVRENTTVLVGKVKYNVVRDIPLEPADTLVISKAIARLIK